MIGTNFGGIPDVIQHNENGFLFENGDIEYLAKCINQLLQDEALRTRLIACGLKTAFDKFEIETTIDHYEKYFLEITQS